MAELRTVAVYCDLCDALVAKSFLESRGFVVFLAGNNHAATDWLLSPALQGVRLLTIEPQLANILKALEEIPVHAVKEQPPMAAQIVAGASTIALSLAGVMGIIMPLAKRWSRFFVQR